jgi:hypothetical protein
MGGCLLGLCIFQSAIKEGDVSSSEFWILDSEYFLFKAWSTQHPQGFGLNGKLESPPYQRGMKGDLIWRLEFQIIIQQFVFFIFIRNQSEIHYLDYFRRRRVLSGNCSGTYWMEIKRVLPRG